MEVKRVYVSNVIVSGTSSQLTAKVADALTLATRYNGKLLRQQTFADNSIFLEVAFGSEGLMQVWESSIGI